MSGERDSARFGLVARLLHWTMAVMIFAMLFIGLGMVSTTSGAREWLYGLHKPLGIAVLALALVRLVWRFFNPPPALPADLHPLHRMGALASHLGLYVLFIAMPLIGWAMLSAEGIPVTLAGTVGLPAIAPRDAVLHAWLRQAHTALAFLLFATVMLHLAAALYHGLIRRDGVLASMTGYRPSSGKWKPR